LQKKIEQRFYDSKERRYPRYPQQPLSIAFLRSTIRTTTPVACLFMVAMIELEDLYVVEDAQDSCAAVQHPVAFFSWLTGFRKYDWASTRWQ
jgi:hypothetical protein